MTNFQLYATCKVVKGASRSTICDLQRQEVIFIPNEVADLLQLLPLPIASIKAHYEHEFDDIIDENFNWLVGKELGFYTDSPEWFPAVEEVWQDPFPVTNSIIDWDKNSAFDLLEILVQLGEIPCRHVQVRCWDKLSLSVIRQLLEGLAKARSPLEGVQFLLPYTKELEDVEAIMDDARLAELTIYGSPEAKTIMSRRPNNTGHIIYSTEVIEGAQACGCIAMERFASNMKMYTESQQHNSCLNRKISLDTQGNIKNCPSMSKSYGNIANTTLEEALEHPDFKSLWNVSKDQIHVCKDCEFRYVCTDCRAFVEDPEDILSKPLKCGYNPYTTEWDKGALAHHA